MSDTQDETTQVNFVVAKDQKSRWKSHLRQDGGEFQSLSRLIRQAVEKEIQTDTTAENKQSEYKYAEVLDAIGRLDERVGELEPRLASIENAVQNDPAARELANQVFECLPTKTELDSYQETVGAAGTQPPDDVLARRQSGTVADLATHLEVPQHRVREALERLQRDTHQVHSRERDGAMRYYKEG